MGQDKAWRVGRKGAGGRGRKGVGGAAGESQATSRKAGDGKEKLAAQRDRKDPGQTLRDAELDQGAISYNQSSNPGA